MGSATWPATNRHGRSSRATKEARKPLPKSYVRLTQPLVRDTKGGELRPATWDEALDRTVAGLSAALASRPGAERPPIGMFSCSKATNEVNYAAQKFSRVVLGSNNIDSCNRT
jgi:formate dehydrogenase major subunit